MITSMSSKEVKRLEEVSNTMNYKQYTYNKNILNNHAITIKRAYNKHNTNTTHTITNKYISIHKSIKGGKALGGAGEEPLGEGAAGEERRLNKYYYY